MPQNASLQLVIDLKAFNAGLQGALRLGQEFASQFNKIASGIQIGVNEAAFTSELKKVEAEIDKLTNKPVDVTTTPAQESIGKVATESTKTTDKVKSNNAIMGNSFVSLAVGVNQMLEILRKAAFAFNDFINKGIEFISSESQLNGALANTGKYTKAAGEGIEAYAQKLQVLLGIDDDLLLKETARMQNLGDFSEKEIPRNIRAAIGLAKIYQVDLPMAFSVFGKVAAGVPVRLSNFGMGAAKAGEQAVSLNELLIKGAAGFELAKKQAETSAGSYQKYGASIDEVKKSMGLLLLDAFSPLMEKITAINFTLSENKTLLKILVGTITTITIALVGAKLATINWTVALTSLKVALATNPLGWILLAVGAIGTAVEATVGWSQVWAVFYNYASAALRITWSYIKAFGLALKDMTILWMQILTLPWQIMYNTASEIFKKLAGMMKKLVSGDFKGIFEDLGKGLIKGVGEPIVAVGMQLQKTLNNFKGLGQNAAAEWRTAGVMAAWAATQGKKSVDYTNMPQGDGSGGGGGDQGAETDKKASLIEAYYSELKWQATGYEEFMKALYQAEWENFLKVTGDKEKADAQLTAHLKALEADKTAYELEQWQKANTEHRRSFEERKADIESYLKKLENWKLLGISVGTDLQKTWDEYLSLLKEKSEDSAQAYQDAQSGNVKTTEEEIGILKTQYQTDLDNYNSAQVKKLEIDKKAAEERRRLWESNNQVLMNGFDAIIAGYTTMFKSMFDTSMSGGERIKAIGNSIKDSLINSFAQTTANWIKSKLIELAIHSTTEKTKTLVTAESEATRTAIHSTNLMVQFAKDVLFGIKWVMLQIWKFGAALLNFFAFLGPFAPIAVAGVLVAAGSLLGKLRKGFKGGGWTGDGNENEEAGVAHKQEVIFESGIAKKNKNSLLYLRNLLQRGINLSDILFPRVQMPTLAYAQGSGNSFNYDRMGDSITKSLIKGMQESNSGQNNPEIHLHVKIDPTTISDLNRKGLKLENRQEM